MYANFPLFSIFKHRPFFDISNMLPHFAQENPLKNPAGEEAVCKNRGEIGHGFAD